MKCPTDGTTLVITERSGVEIDYCPTCRGVWLDRGELDKIIERSGSYAAPPPPPQRAVQGSYKGGAKYPGHKGYKSRKRKEGLGGFLDDIFDF